MQIIITWGFFLEKMELYSFNKFMLIIIFLITISNYLSHPEAVQAFIRINILLPVTHGVWVIWVLETLSKYSWAWRLFIIVQSSYNNNTNLRKIKRNSDNDYFFVFFYCEREKAIKLPNFMANCLQQIDLLMTLLLELEFKIE